MSSSIVALYAVLAAASVPSVMHLRRRPSWARALGALTAVGLAALVAAPLLASGTFAALRLLGHALFVAAPLVLVASALVCWRQRRRLSGVALATAMTIGAVGVYAFFVEPRWLEISRESIASAKLDRPVRVVVVADLQTDHVGAYERRVLAAVMAENPDLILFAGDYIQERDPANNAAQVQALRRALEEAGIAAPLGVFAVRGDVEGPGWTTIFEGTAVTALATTETRDLGPVRLTGLDLDDTRDPRLRIAEGTAFHIVFGHAPDFALADVGADLLVAGHTHGGQVRLPFIGPIITFSAVPRAWAAGVTRLDERRTLVVSRGVGMERGDAPRLRLGCRPELVVIDLVPATAPAPTPQDA